MFGFGPPRCPLDSQAKSWVERRLHWLSREFGRDVFVRRAMVLPTPEFFPDRYDGGEEGVRNLYVRVCERMEVDPGLCRIEFGRHPDPGLCTIEGHAVASAAATWEGGGGHGRILFDLRHAADPASFISTLAHELSHHRLMGEGRLDGFEFDNELLTDLTAMFFGYGLFMANSPRVWRSGYSPWPGSDLLKPEYMTPPMHGYVLAHLAWIRGERRPAWFRFLGSEPRTCFKTAHRFLERTGKSTFAPTDRERRLAPDTSRRGRS